MRRALLLAAVLAGGAFLIGSAGAVHGAAPPTAKVPVPPPNSVSLTKIIVHTKGRFTVHTANDAQLGNLAALYVVQSPNVVYVLLRSFGARRTAAADGGDFDITFETATGPTKDFLSWGASHVLKANQCQFLSGVDGLFESGASTMNQGGRTYTLTSGRSKSAQPSPPEGVLDDYISSALADFKCSEKAEGYDPGNT